MSGVEWNEMVRAVVLRSEFRLWSEWSGVIMVRAVVVRSECRLWSGVEWSENGKR